MFFSPVICGSVDGEWLHGAPLSLAFPKIAALSSLVIECFGCKLTEDKDGLDVSFPLWLGIDSQASLNLGRLKENVNLFNSLVEWESAFCASFKFGALKGKLLILWMILFFGLKACWLIWLLLRIGWRAFFRFKHLKENCILRIPWHVLSLGVWCVVVENQYYALLLCFYTTHFSHVACLCSRGVTIFCSLSLSLIHVISDWPPWSVVSKCGSIILSSLGGCRPMQHNQTSCQFCCSQSVKTEFHDIYYFCHPCTITPSPFVLVASLCSRERVAYHFGSYWSFLWWLT